MEKYHIQKAVIEDAQQLGELLEELFKIEVEFESDKLRQKNAIEHIISHNELGVIFKVLHENQIIGMGSLLFSYSTALNAKVAILEDIIIAKEFRSLGIGDKLIQHIFKYAQSENIQRVTLLTDSTNIKAQSFYKKNGFEHSKMVVMRHFC